MWIIGRLDLIGFFSAVTYAVPSTKPDQRQKCAFLLQATADLKARIGNEGILHAKESNLCLEYSISGSVDVSCA